MNFKALQSLKSYLMSNPWLWVGSTIGLSCALLWQGGAWRTLERVAYNNLMRSQALPIFPQQHWDERIAVIAIDEASLEQYGRFPWERDRYVTLLQNLAFSPPAAIGFDVIFSESATHDADLAQEIAFSGNVAIAQAIRADRTPIPVLPEFTEVAMLGHIVSRPDADGIIREGISYIGDFPALSVAMLELYAQTLDATLSANPLETIDINLPQPLADGQEQTHWLYWKEASDKFATYSFADVAEGNLDPDLFANKLVLIGLTATGYDPLETPFEQVPPTAGVYLHAVMLDNFLTRSFLQHPPQWLILGGLFLLSPITMIVIRSLQLRNRLISLIVAGGSWWLFCLLALVYGQWLLPAIAPIGTILLSGMGLQFFEQYEKQQLMGLFARHVSPEMAEVIWQHKQEIFQQGQLEPLELKATVLFSDIRGFTKISESFTPQELLTWLNKYLDVMTKCIMSHGGIVDKYIGDGIMAVFGVPFAHETLPEIQQDAVRAIAASLDMHDKLQDLNRLLLEQGKPQIEIGVGIHSGTVVAGSVGGRERLSYSVVGDTVNTASRLESLNKDISKKFERAYNIILSSQTAELIQAHYPLESLGTTPIRGKEEDMAIYTVVDVDASHASSVSSSRLD